MSGASSPRFKLPRLPPSLPDASSEYFLASSLKSWPCEQQRIHLVGFAAGRLPPLLALADGAGRNRMCRASNERPDLQLVPVVVEVPVDLLLGDRDTQGDLPARQALDHDLFPDPLLARHPA